MSEAELEPVDLGPLENLEQYQQRLDDDGVMVGVSRQALDEVITLTRALLALRAKPEGEPVAWREALELAYRTFSEYADLHRAKGTRDGDAKADRNAALATVIYEALNTRPPAWPDREAVARAVRDVIGHFIISERQAELAADAIRALPQAAGRPSND